MQATTIYFVTITRKALSTVESLITEALPRRDFKLMTRSMSIDNVTPEEYAKLLLITLPRAVSTNLK